MFHIVDNQRKILIGLKIVVKGGIAVMAKYKSKENMHPVNAACICVLISFP